jgi:hypothetical protein
LRLADELGRRSELLMFNMAKKGLPDVGEEVEGPFGKDRELDKKYYTEKLDRFIRFLRTTAEAGDTIRCSV